MRRLRAALVGALGFAALACDHVPTAEQRWRQAADALASSHFADAVAALDGIEKAPGADRLDGCDVLTRRLVALAGTSRGDDMLHVAHLLVNRCESRLNGGIIERAGGLLLDAGGSVKDSDALLAVAPSLHPSAREEVRRHLERRRAGLSPLDAAMLERLESFGPCDD